MFFAGAFAKRPSACPVSPSLNIVAAENFYQDIARQIAGPAPGKSVLSDPNVDPHEYEPTVNDAEEVAAANLVIENGGGYDDWMKSSSRLHPIGPARNKRIGHFACKALRKRSRLVLRRRHESRGGGYSPRSQEVAPFAGRAVREKPQNF